MDEGQSTHACWKAEPGILLYFPAAQLMQSVLKTSPVCELKVPSGQLFDESALVWPNRDCHLPAGVGMQAVSAVLSAYFPLSHGEQLEEDPTTALNSPLLHTRQSED